MVCFVNFETVRIYDMCVTVTGSCQRNPILRTLVRKSIFPVTPQKRFASTVAEVERPPKKAKTTVNVVELEKKLGDVVDRLKQELVQQSTRFDKVTSEDIAAIVMQCVLMEMDNTKRLPRCLDVVVMVQKVRRACTFHKSAQKKQQ